MFTSCVRRATEARILYKLPYYCCKNATFIICFLLTDRKFSQFPGFQPVKPGLNASGSGNSWLSTSIPVPWTFFIAKVPAVGFPPKYNFLIRTCVFVVVGWILFFCWNLWNNYFLFPCRPWKSDILFMIYSPALVFPVSPNSAPHFPFASIFFTSLLLFHSFHISFLSGIMCLFSTFSKHEFSVNLPQMKKEIFLRKNASIIIIWMFPPPGSIR